MNNDNINELHCLKIEDKDNYTKRQWVKMINSLSGFKSANLIGTVSKKGIPNASMISSVFHLGANPPLMGFVLRPHSEDSPRHTLLNIQETSFFTINHVNKNHYKKAHQASARYPRDISEFDACDLEIEENIFPAPYLKDAHVKIGLKFVNTYLIKENATQIMVGEIIEFYAPQACFYEDGHIDLEQAGSLTVSGLDSYHQTKKVARLNYAKPEIETHELKVKKETLV